MTPGLIHKIKKFEGEVHMREQIEKLIHKSDFTIAMSDEKMQSCLPDEVDHTPMFKEGENTGTLRKRKDSFN